MLWRNGKICTIKTKLSTILSYIIPQVLMLTKNVLFDLCYVTLWTLEAAAWSCKQMWFIRSQPMSRWHSSLFSLCSVRTESHLLHRVHPPPNNHREVINSVWGWLCVIQNSFYTFQKQTYQSGQTILFRVYISTRIWWLLMGFFTDIYSPHRKNPKDLFFPLVHSWTNASLGTTSISATTKQITQYLWYNDQSLQMTVSNNITHWEGLST